MSASRELGRRERFGGVAVKPAKKKPSPKTDKARADREAKEKRRDALLEKAELWLETAFDMLERNPSPFGTTPAPAPAPLFDGVPFPPVSRAERIERRAELYLETIQEPTPVDVGNAFKASEAFETEADRVRGAVPPVLPYGEDGSAARACWIAWEASTNAYMAPEVAAERFEEAAGILRKVTKTTPAKVSHHKGQDASA